MAEPSTARNSLPESALRIGERLGPYVVESLLGVGGMAEVYVVRHTALDKRLALKILKAEPARSDELRQRFLREGQSASRIDHPHIVAINDVVDDGERVYIVMELLEGETLGAVMERDLILPVQRVLDYLVPVISAMGASHERGVVHRDLKPDNIFLARDASGRAFPKVLDFGVSKLADHVAPRVTATDTVLGTPHYMAPEQALGRRNVDGKADQFALGIIFYEAIVGRLPYSGTSSIELIHEVARGEVARPSVFKSWVPKDLEDLLMRALSANPEDRYATMEEFGLALLPFANERTQEQWQGALSGLTKRSSFPPPGEARSPSGRERIVTAPQRPARVTPASDIHGDLVRQVRQEALAQSGQRAVERGPLATPSPARFDGPLGPDGDVRASASTPAPARRTGLFVGLGAVTLLAVGGALYAWSAQPVVRAVQLHPAAHVSVDGHEIGSGSVVTITLPHDGQNHHILVSAVGYESFEATVLDLEHLPAQITLSEAPVPVAAETTQAVPSEPTEEPAPAAMPPAPPSANAEEATTPTSTGMSERARTRPIGASMDTRVEPEEDLRFAR
jgi:serine/threonine-protein kinase